MKTSTVATLSFIAGWATAASTTVYYIAREDEPPPVEKPIARLVEKDGALDYRGEDDLLWRGAGLHQPFGERTRVATGRGSKATIALEDGRKLEIDADSLIVLTKDDSVFSQDQSAFIVTLAKGKVVVKDAPKDKAVAARPARGKGAAPPRKLILKTSDQIVTVKESSSEVVLAKPQLEGPSEVQAAEGDIETQPAPPPPLTPAPAVVALPSITPPELTRTETSQATDSARDVAPPSSTAVASTTATATSTAPTTEEIAARSGEDGERKVAPDPPPPQRFVMRAAAPAPAAAPMPPAVKMLKKTLQSRPRITKLPLMVRGHEPRLEVSRREGGRDMVLWTLESLATGIPPVAVTLAPPEDRPKPAWSWTPLVRVHAGEKRPAVIRGRAAWEPQRFDLNLDGSSVGGEGMTVELIAGVSGSRDDETLRSFGGPSSTLQLRSLADLPARPLTVTVSLVKGSGRDELPGWLVESRSLGKRDDPRLMRIGLRQGRDAARLFPLLEASGGFRIDPGVEEFGASSDLVLVRDQAVLAVVLGARQPKPAMIARLARLLDADFAYLGAASALIPKMTDLASLEAESRRVFAINIGHGEPFYGVRQVFLRDYPNVERFVKANSMALFDRPVELVWRRPVESLTAVRAR